VLVGRRLRQKHLKYTARGINTQVTQSRALEVFVPEDVSWWSRTPRVHSTRGDQNEQLCLIFDSCRQHDVMVLFGGPVHFAAKHY
jgi:hypothetical protein